jgi:hypothetical protein
MAALKQKLALSIEVRMKSGLPFKVKSSDNSSSGCYLEMMTPLPIGTVVEVSFKAHRQRQGMADFKTGDLAACRLDGQSDYFLFARQAPSVARRCRADSISTARACAAASQALQR